MLAQRQQPPAPNKGKAMQAQYGQDSQADLTVRETRARARAIEADRVAAYALKVGLPQAAPNDTPSDAARSTHLAAMEHKRNERAKEERNALRAASQPNAIAKSRARADERAQRASERKAARLARYMRGGNFAPAHNDGRGLARFGLSLPFVRQGDDRARYFALWTRADAIKLDAAGNRAARSVRRGRVSDTSREEAKAAARASLINSAVALAPIHLSAAIDRVCHCPDAIALAVAAARASLRGEALAGVTGRDGELTGRAVANDDGNGGLVWSIERGEWIKVKRADGATAFDLAGRILCAERGSIDDDSAARAWARDAVRLVGWLVRLRLARLAGERGQSVAPCVRSRIRCAASKVARVLRSMARGESLAMACSAVGFSVASECRAWRKAIGALTDGRGLADAMRDYRASAAI